MSNPIAIIQVVGMIMGAKTAIEGLKEGNLLKAVMGGVGAVMGYQGFTSSMAASGATETAAATIPDAATDPIQQGMGAVAEDAVVNATNLSITPEPIIETGMDLVSQNNTGLIAPQASNSMLNNAVKAEIPYRELTKPVEPVIEPKIETAPKIKTAGAPEAAQIETPQVTQAPTTNFINDTASGLLKGTQDIVGGGIKLIGDGVESAYDQFTKMMTPQEAAKQGVEQGGQQGLLRTMAANPYLLGAGMQMLGGNQQNRSLREQAEENRRERERNRMLAATPANFVGTFR